jgi:hypothetical protein
MRLTISNILDRRGLLFGVGLFFGLLASFPALTIIHLQRGRAGVAILDQDGRDPAVQTVDALSADRGVQTVSAGVEQARARLLPAESAPAVDVVKGFRSPWIFSRRPSRRPGDTLLRYGIGEGPRLSVSSGIARRRMPYKERQPVSENPYLEPGIRLN